MALQIKAKVRIDIKKLKAIPRLVEQAIIKGLKKGAAEVERNARKNAPYEHGDLFRSIRASSVKRTANGFSVSISPNVPYAAAMERPGRVLRRGRRPYMLPAVTESIPKIINHLKNEIRKVIK